MGRMTRILGLMIAVVVAGYCPVVVQAAPTLSNGIVYLLVPRQLDRVDEQRSGVYRLNTRTPAYDTFYPGGQRLFNLAFTAGNVEVSGLSVSPEARLYLLKCPLPSSGDVYTEVSQEGWLPPAGAFDPNSKAYLHVVGQPYDPSEISADPHSSTSGDHNCANHVTNYYNSLWNHGPPYWTHSHHRYVHSPGNDAFGNHWDYVFTGGGSIGTVKLWSGIGGRVLLPNKWAAISYYAIQTRGNGTTFPNDGTSPHVHHIGCMLDGSMCTKAGWENYRHPTVKSSDFRLNSSNTGGRYPWPDNAGWYCSPNQDAISTIFVIQRIYMKHDRTLDLLSYLDSNPPPNGFPALEPGGQGMLSATDLKIKENYRKSCGDGCVGGGELPNAQVVAGLEARIQVCSTTTGRRYAFNPNGNRSNANDGNNTALRVAAGGNTYGLKMDAPGVLQNLGALTSRGIAVSDIQTVAGSSNFANFTPPPPPVLAVPPDRIYGSNADKFAVQDSWWGNGAIAYEYYARDSVQGDGLQGKIYRCNYIGGNNERLALVGNFSGDIDSIGVDGNSFLYVARTELDCPNDPAGGPVGYAIPCVFPNPDALAHPRYVSHEWFHFDGDRNQSLGANPDIASLSEGDFCEFRFQQRIVKRVTRYETNSGGGVSAGEPWGEVDAGYDVIMRQLQIASGGGFVWAGPWANVDGPTTLKALVDVELAVMNIATRPCTLIPINDERASVCRVDVSGNPVTYAPTVAITEDQEVGFKVEGLCPIRNGAFVDLENMGQISGVGNPVFINKNVNVAYADRSDNDDDFGNRSVFSDSLCVMPGVAPIEIKWNIDRLDPDGNVVEHVLQGGAADLSLNIPGFNLYPALKVMGLKYKFPNPGNYRVWAKVTHRYFDFNALADGARPTDLLGVMGTKTFETEKVTFKVQAAENVERPPLFISNVSLLPAALVPPTAPPISTDQGPVVEVIEDQPLPPLQFSFDVQFIQDRHNSNPAELFAAGDGIGVWDYNSYDFGPWNNPALDPVVLPIVLTTPPEVAHVYNYANPLTPDDHFNPGRSGLLIDLGGGNETASQRYRCGTNFVEGVTPHDKKAIRWRLYLHSGFVVPNRTSGTSGSTAAAEQGSMHRATPGSPIAVAGDGDARLGYVIASGTCVTAAVGSDLGNRKHNFSVTIPSITMNTPIDPATYSLRLEIEAPRLAWVMRHSSNPAPAGVTQYYSIEPDLDAGNAQRVEVVSSYQRPSSSVVNNNTAFNGADAWVVRVRDVTDPPAVGIISMLERIQTTGDPVDAATYSYAVSDNNPVARFNGFGLEYQAPTDPRDVSVSWQPSVSADPIDGYWANPSPAPSPGLFPLRNDYVVGASYSVLLTPFGDAAGFSPLFSPGRNFVNWVGTLSVSVVGTVEDGYQLTDSEVSHRYGHSEPAPFNTTVVALRRYDNDPPSIALDIVSPSDNHRWNYQFSEGIIDRVAVPTTVGNLGFCQLFHGGWSLDGTPDAQNGTETEVIGSTNYPSAVGNPVIRIDDFETSGNPHMSVQHPVVKKSSRLMLNVQMFDNVDWPTPYSSNDPKTILQSAVLTVNNTDPVAGPQVLLRTGDNGVPAMPLSPNSPGDSLRVLPTPRPPEFPLLDGNFMTARYHVDVPQRVNPTQPQLEIVVEATDSQGNRRELRVPITVRETSFDARILESSERTR